MVISVMLRTSPQRRRESAIRSSSRPPRTGHPGTEHRARTHTIAGAMAEAYGGFLELPVPVVLVMLWLIGVALLGAVSLGAYSTVVWLLAAT